jgi:hypothetical protein
MTANIQVSARLDDGRIYVVGAETPGEFLANLVELYGDQGVADQVFEDLRAAILDPTSGQQSNSAPPSVPAQQWNNPPPVQQQPTTPGAPVCPSHGPMKFHPPGVSKSSGKSYSSSYRCGAYKCDTKAVWNND